LISDPFFYLLVLTGVVTLFYILDTKLRLKLFNYVPTIVMIYGVSMLLGSSGIFMQNAEIEAIYSLTKTNLLPAMLFLLLLQVDFRDFFYLGRSLIVAYLLALVSIGLSFVIVVSLFNFSPQISAAFGALAGSWMGGSANMVAVGEALGVSEEAFAYALVVDSVNYTLWLLLMLLLVPFAQFFNRFTKARARDLYLNNLGCACSVGAPRYWLLIAVALSVSFVSQVAAERIVIQNSTTSMVLFATLFGVIGSFTRLRRVHGSKEISSSMLYLLIALIGSQALIESFDGLALYVFAGASILLLHAIMMIIGAKLFKLDLFSVAIASLANIGGVASAPILAAAYNKNLVSIGVVMAIMGYIVGTFGGILVGNILVQMSR